MLLKYPTMHKESLSQQTITQSKISVVLLLDNLCLIWKLMVNLPTWAEFPVVSCKEKKKTRHWGKQDSRSNKQIKAIWRKNETCRKKKHYKTILASHLWPWWTTGTKQLGIQTSLGNCFLDWQQDCLSHLSPGFGFCLQGSSFNFKKFLHL